MPTEILSLIFNFAILLPRGDNPSLDPALWTIPQICSRWRVIIISLPSLWAVIDLDLRHGWANMSHSRLGTQLQRSRQSPLHITLDCSTMGLHCAQETKLINMLIEHCRRWETCAISFPIEGDDSFLHRVQGRLPRLRELTLAIRPPSTAETESYDQVRYSCGYFENAPTLRKVSVIGPIPMTVKLPFPRLLRYRGTDTWNDHLTSLRSACNLVDCALQIKETVGVVPATRILLPCLRRLAVTTAKFLRCIDAPVIQELHCTGRRIPQIVTFLQRTPRKLEILFLHQCGASEPAPDFAPLLHAAPALTHLGVQFTDAGHSGQLYSLLTPPTGGAEMPLPVPHLKTISVCLRSIRPGSKVDTSSRFMDMLESRWRAGRLRCVNFSGVVPNGYFNWPEILQCTKRMEALREEGMKISLNTKPYRDDLLLDMISEHLRLDY